MESGRKQLNFMDFMKKPFIVMEKKFITSHFPILKWMDFIVNLEPVMYERFFAGIFSPEEVYFKLKVIK